MNNNIAPKDKKDKPETVTNNPEEAMTEPKDVQESNDPKIDQDFSGFPHYPAKEEIINGNDEPGLDAEGV